MFNAQNQQMYMPQSFDIAPTHSGLNNNRLDLRLSQNQSFFDLQKNDSFHFNLSRGSSKNSLVDFNYSKLDLYKSPSFNFNK